jgi:hypothetical protein
MSMSLLRHTPTLFVLILLLTSCDALNEESPYCPPGPHNEITLVYYAAEDGKPLIGEESSGYRFAPEDITLSPITPREATHAGSLRYDRKNSPKMGKIHFNHSICVGKQNETAPCFEVAINFHGAFTDTLSSQFEYNSEGQLLLIYSLNGQRIAEDENSMRMGGSSVGEIAVYR